MNFRTSLALLGAALLVAAAGAQTPAPEQTPAPPLEIADTPPPLPDGSLLPEPPTRRIVRSMPDASASPTASLPPLPPLQPLATVHGTHVTLPKGFPFSSSGNDFTVSVGGDEERPVVHEVQGTDILKNVVLPIVIVSIVFLCPVLIIAVVLFYRSRKTRAFLQTINGFVAKGQPIPPELLYKDGGKPLPTTKSDRRRGLMLTFTGLGLIFYFLAVGSDSWGVGFIPMLIGIGYLLASKFAPRDGSDR